MVNLTKTNLNKQSSFDLLKTNPGSTVVKQTLINDIGNLADFLNIPIVPVLPNLVPVVPLPGNSSVNATPAGPIDPMDCAAWPDSPYCGGMPFSFPFFSFNVSLVVGQCDIGVEFSLTIAGVTTPPHQIVYHSNAPECLPFVTKVEEETEDIVIPQLDGNFWLAIVPSKVYSKMPVLKLISDDPLQLELRYMECTYTCAVISVDEHARNDEYVAITCAVNRIGNYDKVFTRDAVRAEDCVTISGFTAGTQTDHGQFAGYPFLGMSGSSSLVDQGDYYLESMSGTTTIFIRKYPLELANSNYQVSGIGGNIIFFGPEGNYQTNSFFRYAGDFRYSPRVEEINTPTYQFLFSFPGLTAVNYASYMSPAGAAQLVEQYKSTSTTASILVNQVIGQARGSENPNFPTAGTGRTFITDDAYAQIGEFVCNKKYTVTSGLLGNPLPPPPPPPMQCCPSPFDPGLLNLILANQIKMMAAIGVEDYPATLPESLIEKDEGFFGNLIPNAPIEVTSLTQLLGQFIRYFDEVSGQYEQAVQIKDTDPTTPGDQPVGIRLPNNAEAQAEIFSLSFQNSINLDLLINIGTRILTEVGQIKQQDFKSYGLTQTLVDYFNYEYSEVAKDLPLSFVPGKENFDELLKETIIKVSYPEYTDTDNFKKALQRLLEGAAIIKALNWKKIDPTGNVKQQFIDSVKEKANQLKKEAERQGISLDAFLAEAELGFPATPGIPNPELPYGEPMDQRPIVAKLQEED